MYRFDEDNRCRAIDTDLYFARGIIRQLIQHKDVLKEGLEEIRYPWNDPSNHVRD